MLAGKAAYVVGVGALGYLSKFVHDPLSGLAVGAASVLVAYISSIIQGFGEHAGKNTCMVVGKLSWYQALKASAVHVYYIGEYVAVFHHVD